MINDAAATFVLNNKAVNLKKFGKVKSPCIINDKIEYVKNKIREAAQAPEISVA